MTTKARLITINHMNHHVSYSVIILKKVQLEMKLYVRSRNIYLKKLRKNLKQAIISINLNFIISILEKREVHVTLFPKS